MRSPIRKPFNGFSQLLVRKITWLKPGANKINFDCGTRILRVIHGRDARATLQTDLLPDAGALQIQLRFRIDV